MCLTHWVLPPPEHSSSRHCHRSGAGARLLSAAGQSGARGSQTQSGKCHHLPHSIRHTDHTGGGGGDHPADTATHGSEPHPHGSPAPQPRPLSRPHTLPGPDACVALSGSGHCRPAGRGHRSRGLEPPILPPRPGVQIRAPPQAGDKLLWPQFPRGPFTRLREAQGVVWAGVCRPRSSLNRPPPRCLASTPTHTALHCPSAG